MTTPNRSRKIFVNLPVRDLKRSIEFFTRLGFSFKLGEGVRTALELLRDEA